jgi:hypothetical protein
VYRSSTTAEALTGLHRVGEIIMARVCVFDVNETLLDLGP